MITLFFAVNRRIEQQGYTKKNKKQEEICPQGNFVARQPEKNLQPKKTLDRVSVERDPQC
jgi:hypothetical protein